METDLTLQDLRATCCGATSSADALGRLLTAHPGYSTNPKAVSAFTAGLEFIVSRTGYALHVPLTVVQQTQHLLLCVGAIPVETPLGALVQLLRATDSINAISLKKGVSALVYGSYTEGAGYDILMEVTRESLIIGARSMWDKDDSPVSDETSANGEAATPADPAKTDA